MLIRSYGNPVICTHISETDKQDNPVQWLGSDKDAIQVGILKREGGTYIKPHLHLPVSINTCSSQEVIILRSGQLQVTLYDNQNDYVGSFIMKPNDIMIQTGGGHGFKCLEDVVFVEAKQGPFYSDTKRYFNPLEHEQSR